MWRFYVYELMDGAGKVLYVGKGSGNRLSVQKRLRGMCGHEVARFKRERDAYAFEVKHIANVAPSLNKCRGGNGPRTIRRKDVVRGWTPETLAKSQKECALLLLRKGYGITIGDPSKLDEIRRVAYG